MSCGNETILEESPCWFELSSFRCLSSRLWDLPHLRVLCVLRHPRRLRGAGPVTGRLHLPGRGPQRCAGSRMGPGCPCRASGAVDHRAAFAPAGTSGASHVLRRRSAGLPRPADSGGPAPPRPDGGARVACGSVHTRGVRLQPWRSCPSTAGCAVPHTASRLRWLRFVPRVRHVYHHDSAMDARLATGGWLALTRPGLAPCQRRQACLARSR